MAFTRNLSDNIFVEEDRRWTSATSFEVPLESDELSLEYLCKHKYDVPLAKFKLMCLMASGKGKCINLILYLIYLNLIN